MKKNYETPALELLVLKTGEFLSASTELDNTGVDDFNDSYGQTFA